MNDLLKLHKTVGGGNRLNKLTYREYLDEHFNLGELKEDVIVEGNKLITLIHKEPFLYFKTTTTKNEGSDTSLVVTDRGMVVEETPEFKYSFKITGKQKLDISGGLITRLCSGNDYTIDFQLKTHSRLTPYSRILDADQLRLGYYNTENLWQCKYFDGTSQATRTFTPTIGEWQQITLMRKDGVNYFFVDGVLIHSIEGTVSTFTEGLFRIGYTYNYSNDNYYNGSIAHFRIFDMAIFSPTGFEPFKCDEDYAKYKGHRISPQITTPRNLVSAKCDWEGEGNISMLYERACTLDNDIKFYMDGKTLSDISEYKVAIANTGLTVGTQEAYLFNSGNFISMPIDFDINGSWTIDYYIKFTSSATSSVPLMGNVLLDVSETAFCSLAFMEIIDSKFNYLFDTSASTTNWDAKVSSVHPLKLNTWEHIAIVKNGSTIKIYVDGVCKSTTTLSAKLTESTYPFHIGKWRANTVRPNFELKGFRVTQKALWNDTFSLPDILGTEIKEKPLNNNEVFSISTRKFQLKQEVKGEETISNVKLEMKYKPKKEYIRPKNLIEDGEEYTIPTTNLLVHLDGSNNVSSTSWNDLCGNHNATLLNSPTQLYGECVRFNGTNQCAYLPKFTHTSFSIIVKVKILADTVNGKVVCCQENGGYSIQIHHTTANKQIGHRTWLGGAYVNDFTDYLVNEISVYALTYDNGVLDLYKNGLKISSRSGTLTYSTKNAVLTIGANPNFNTSNNLVFGDFLNMDVYKFLYYTSKLDDATIKEISNKIL